MYAPYPENMMESIKKVEATRAQRMATEPRRLSADEKDALLKKFHPDYNPDAFADQTKDRRHRWSWQKCFTPKAVF